MFVAEVESSILKKIKPMEWYLKNRWWVWSISGVYLIYRFIITLYY